MIGSILGHRMKSLSTRRSQRSSRSRLTLESLEGRELLAGDFDLVSDMGSAVQLWAQLPQALLLRTDDGNELNWWRTNGATSGTQRLRDLLPSSVPFGPVVDGSFYFVAGDGRELWKTDLTAEGTVLLKSSDEWMRSVAPRQLLAVNDNLYFVAASEAPGIHATAIWVTNGTPEGTKPIVPECCRNGEVALAEWNGHLVLFSELSDRHVELSTTDGTEAGTRAVPLWELGQVHALPRSLTAVGNVIYLVANTDDGEALWITNGTSRGTARVPNIWPGPFGPRFGTLTSAGESLYFVAQDEQRGRELYRRRAAAGPTELLEIHAGAGDAFDPRIPDGHQLRYAFGKLFFLADDGIHGEELWVIENDTASPRLLADILPGDRSSQIRDFHELHGRLYFTAYDPRSGRQLWETDGTVAGTRIVTAVSQGESLSDVAILADLHDRLVVRATSLEHGSELWIERKTSTDSVRELDELAAAMRRADPAEDMNGDDRTDFTDLDFLVNDLLRSRFGDANLDRTFNSSDLVLAFQSGEYEDGVLGNSTWSDGDWNGDGEFNSADLVLAFQRGGYSI